MTAWRVVTLFLAIVVGAGCGSAAGGSGTNPTPSTHDAVKRITLGSTFEPDLRPGSTAPASVVVPLVHTGLTVLGDQRERRPRLAEAVPSLDNGLWKLLPDGRMETTWKLRASARWSDSAPLTADDLLFSLEVGRDKEMSAFSAAAYASIEEVTAPDPQTMTISWKEPTVDAVGVLDGRGIRLLPRHLLEAAYRSDKASFLDLPYWTSEFVGAGPYRIREWIPGVGMELDADDAFVLGRPRIDEITVKYFPDANTLTVNLLAGTVDVTHVVGSVDLGVQLREQWRDGAVVFNFGSDNWMALYPQFIEPRPGAVADLQFRRALAYAIDRQEIVDTLVAGMSPVPHSFLSPNQLAYREIEATIPRYDYDARRAAQMLEAVGYRKGADGIYQDESGQRLELQVTAAALEESGKAASAVADYWKRLGVDATAVRSTPQQTQDAQYVATFPAFWVFGGPNDVSALRTLYSSQARLPTNSFRVAGSGNRSRYMNPEFDALLDRYFKTVPLPERTQALGEISRHIADQVTVFGLYYNPVPGAAANRLLNVSHDWPGFTITWNAYEWDVAS